MAFELRLGGNPPALFDTEPEAVEAARQALLHDPDAEPEIYDTSTGEPCAPGASKNWREEMKNRVGF